MTRAASRPPDRPTTQPLDTTGYEPVAADDDDAALSDGERLLRRMITGVGPRQWFWLVILATSHLAGYPLALAFIAAVLDALFLLSAVWQVDQYEEEPWRLVERTFLWGAFPAVLLALIGEMVLGGVGPAAQRLDVVFVAPIVEEVCKGAMLVALFRRQRDEFDGMLDGLVYGALVGLGFSMTENVTYYVRAQPDAVAGLIFMRGVLFGMNHACFSACFGLGLGISRDATTRALRRWAPVAGLGAAIGLHMMHNFLASARAVPLRFAALGLAAVAVVIWFRLVAVARAREAHWIDAELGEEVANGAMSAEEAETTRDVKFRKAARADALLEKTYGPAHIRLRFYALATELAFAKHKAKLEPHASRYAARISSLRRRVAQIRIQRQAAGNV